MMALAVEAVVAEAVAALGRSSGHEATHHAPSEQGLSQTLLEELLTLLSEQPPPLEVCVLTARRRTKLGTGLVVAAQPRVQ